MAVADTAAAADSGASADRNGDLDVMVARADARAIVFQGSQRRHARPCAGHPRLMPGFQTNPASQDFARELGGLSRPAANA